MKVKLKLDMPQTGDILPKVIYEQEEFRIVYQENGYLAVQTFSIEEHKWVYENEGLHLVLGIPLTINVVKAVAPGQFQAIPK